MVRRATSRRMKRFGRSKKWRRPRRRVALRSGSLRKTHYFKRSVYAPAALTIQNNGTSANGTITYNLQMLPNYTEYTNLYDLYSLKMVVTEFIPQANVAQVAVMGMPMIHTAIDYNDDSPPVALSDLLQYETYKSNRGTSVHKRVLRPKVAPEVYNSSVSSGYMTPMRSTWLATSSPAVPHFCLKYSVSPLTTGGDPQTMYIDIKHTYYFACRSVR